MGFIPKNIAFLCSGQPYPNPGSGACQFVVFRKDSIFSRKIILFRRTCQYSGRVFIRYGTACPPGNPHPRAPRLHAPACRPGNHRPERKKVACKKNGKPPEKKYLRPEKSFLRPKKHAIHTQHGTRGMPRPQAAYGTFFQAYKKARLLTELPPEQPDFFMLVVELSLCLDGSGVDTFFLDTCLLTGEVTQVVQFSTTHLTNLVHLDALDSR